MKIRELIDKLKLLDPDLEVVGYTEDQDLLASGHLFRLFDIETVIVSEAEKTRADDGVPTYKLGKTGHSKPHAVLEMTGSF